MLFLFLLLLIKVTDLLLILLFCYERQVKLSMNLIPVTTKTLSIIILATEYGSTNNVIPIRS